MVASPAAIEQDAWRLFDVDYRTTGGGLAAYLDRILARCIEWFDASSASIFLLSEDGNDYRFVAGEQSLRSARIRKGAGIAGLVAQTGEAMLINDPESHPLLRGQVKRRAGAPSSSIVVPLSQPDGTSVGVLNLARDSGKPEFDLGDLGRVQSIANQVSLAVVNARLFAEVTRAVAEAEKAGDKLQAVLRSLGVAVLVVDSHDRVTDWNDQAEQLFSLTGPAPYPIADLEPHGLAKALESALSKARDQGPQHRRFADGRDRTWSITTNALTGGAATATIEDATDHERAQAEMNRLKRLAEVGQMTAAIAHEIRNPLTGIRSAAQLIATNPDQAEEFAAIIDEEVLKLNSLCEQFLEFARPLALRIAPMVLGDVVRGVVDRHRQDFSDRQVQLTVEIGREKPTILADAFRLEQVTRNLLLNALQSCSPGGSVQISAGDRWLAVEDDGCGMTAEEQHKLFTPFFTTKASGTGLGLSNLRKIVDAHHGTVSVSSEVGKGSRFLVTLPAEDL